MFDSHCHLHDERLRPDVDALVARARGAGVTGILLAGVEPEGWRDELAIAAKYPEILVSFGIHPQLVPELSERAAAEMLEELRRAVRGEDGWRRPVAVGEIGLDAYTDARRACLDRQAALFAAQLEIARAADLPVCLHILSAHARALEVLRQVGLPARGGVVHSYSGSAELLRDYLGLGLHISFTGIVTSSRARKAKLAVPLVPADRLLVETDAPDQVPEARRPGLNEPAFLGDVIAAIATLRGESVAEVARCSEENARRLFVQARPGARVEVG